MRVFVPGPLRSYTDGAGRVDASGSTLDELLAALNGRFPGFRFRIIDEQDQVRAMLSESLRAVVSQRLVPNAEGTDRIPALELLVINRAIGNMIRDEKTTQIRSSMQTGKAHGMYLLEQSLNDLVAEGKITRDVALELAEEEKLITAGA